MRRTGMKQVHFLVPEEDYRVIQRLDMNTSAVFRNFLKMLADHARAGERQATEDKHDAAA